MTVDPGPVLVIAGLVVLVGSFLFMLLRPFIFLLTLGLGIAVSILLGIATLNFTGDGLLAAAVVVSILVFSISWALAAQLLVTINGMIGFSLGWFLLLFSVVRWEFFTNVLWPTLWMGATASSTVVSLKVALLAWGVHGEDSTLQRERGKKAVSGPPKTKNGGR